MLQLIYVSSRSPDVPAFDVDDIVTASQSNNRRDGITGLLYSDGRRFLQVVEGPSEVVERLRGRLAKDRRHRAIVTLSQRQIDRREFGSWAMAGKRPGENDHAFSMRIRALCRHADPMVLGTFLGFIEARSMARG